MGEHGKGFAVVAAEVRKLAERSKITAEDIVHLASSSYQLAEDTGKEMADVIPNIEKTTTLVQEITAASLEQNNGSEQVSNALLQLNNITQNNASVGEELASSSEQLKNQAKKLKIVLAFFTTSE